MRTKLLYIISFNLHKTNAHEINTFAEEMKFSEQTTSQTLNVNDLKEITIQRKLNLVRKQIFQQGASWLSKTVVD